MNFIKIHSCLPNTYACVCLVLTKCSNRNFFTFEHLPLNALSPKVSENRRIIELQTASEDQVDTVSNVFSAIKCSDFTRKKKKVIICPELDMLIAKCPACNLGLPKIFLPDADDIDDDNEFGGAMIPGRSERRFDKEKRFGKSKTKRSNLACRK